MSDELSPCPFCGGAAKLYGRSETAASAVNCQSCDAYGKSVMGASNAIAAWNRRAPMASAPVLPTNEQVLTEIRCQCGYHPMRISAENVDEVMSALRAIEARINAAKGGKP